MVMAFFDAAGIIYSHIVLRVKSVNAAYIVKVLKVFVKTMRQKSPQLVNQGFVFHWDNSPVHTAVIVDKWFAAAAIQRLELGFGAGGLLPVSPREGGPGSAHPDGQRHQNRVGWGHCR